MTTASHRKTRSHDVFYHAIVAAERKKKENSSLTRHDVVNGDLSWHVTIEVAITINPDSPIPNVSLNDILDLDIDLMETNVDRPLTSLDRTSSLVIY
jgi:hypothetical protein